VTLKDGSEGLIYCDNYRPKFLDPFLLSDDEMDITDAIKNSGIITKSNRKFSIIENKVCVTDGLNEDTFQQILNKTTYHNNIYTLSIFKTIQNMLKDIINNDKICNIPNDGIKLSNGELFHFGLGPDNRVTGCICASSRISYKIDTLFSYKQLNNQDLALITSKGIFIYTVVENDEGRLKLRYFWSNEKWNIYYKDSKNTIDDRDDYKPLIQEILDNEFNDFVFSLPSPNFITIFENFNDEYDFHKELVLSIINDPVEFSKFGSNVLEIAIDKNEESIVQLIFDQIFKLIENNLAEDNKYLLQIISLNLPKLVFRRVWVNSGVLTRPDP